MLLSEDSALLKAMGSAPENLHCGCVLAELNSVKMQCVKVDTDSWHANN